MQVRDILVETEEFPTVATDDTVGAVARVMRDSGVRAVPVVEGSSLLGIVTDWDIVEAFSERSEQLAELPVSSIMTKDGLITIDIDSTVVDATAKLAEHRVHHLLVTEGTSYRGVICLGLEWTEGGMMSTPGRPTLTARRP